MASQDMPPPGGFQSIHVERIFAKPFISGPLIAAAAMGMTLYGYEYIKHYKRRQNMLRIERCEHHIAVQPFYLAEHERRFLSYLRYLREEERELMKDHDGWIVGTLYGEAVYKSLPKHLLPPIPPSEFNKFRSMEDFRSTYVMPDDDE